MYLKPNKTEKITNSQQAINLLKIDNAKLEQEIKHNNEKLAILNNLSILDEEKIPLFFRNSIPQYSISSILFDEAILKNFDKYNRSEYNTININVSMKNISYYEWLLEGFQNPIDKYYEPDFVLKYAIYNWLTENYKSIFPLKVNVDYIKIDDRYSTSDRAYYHCGKTVENTLGIKDIHLDDTYYYCRSNRNPYNSLNLPNEVLPYVTVYYK